MKQLPSRFSYVEDCYIEKTTIMAKIKPKNEASGEQKILEYLAKYGFLNLKMIENLLHLHKSRIKEPANSLIKMQQRGLINKYTIYYPDRDIANIDLYCLSMKSRQKFNAEKKNIYPIYKYDMKNIPYLLENLCIAQWHITVASKKGAKEILYNRRIDTKYGITTINSIVKFRASIGKNINLCTIPVVKGKNKKDLGKFIAKITMIDSYMRINKDQYPSYLIAIVCESESQIEDVSKILSEIRETKGLYILYSIDSITADIERDPLEMMYEVERTVGQTKTQILSIR